MPPLSSPSQQGAFRNYPGRYPKARQRATLFVQHLVEMQKRGPRSIVATVVDTSFHVTRGYVTCTTDKGVVNVLSVPFGTVVSGMRLFCRQIGGASTNHAYIYDGFAPALSSFGTTGAVMVNSPLSGSSSVVSTTSIGMPTVSSLGTSVGYYWHFFVYLPTLPTATRTLFQMKQSSGSNVLFLEHLPTGLLQFRSQDGHGMITTIPVSPHQMHWIQIQPGLSGQEFLIDTVSAYTGLLGGGDIPTFTANTATYGGWFLCNSDGTQPFDTGTWVTKMGYGVNFSGGAVALSNILPQSDSDIPTLNIGVSQKTLNLYLCEDTPGSSTLANAGPGGGSVATVTSPAIITATGPY